MSQIQHVFGPHNCSTDVLVNLKVLNFSQPFLFNFLLHSNAQRPSAITSMTKEELLEGLKRRRLGDMQRAVIVVKEHKTGLSRK